MTEENSERVFIIESFPSGYVEAYDGRTAEDLSEDDLKNLKTIIEKLLK